MRLIVLGLFIGRHVSPHASYTCCSSSASFQDIHRPTRSALDSMKSGLLLLTFASRAPVGCASPAAKCTPSLQGGCLQAVDPHVITKQPT